MIQSSTAASDLNLIESADRALENGVSLLQAHNTKPLGKHHKIHAVSDTVPMQNFGLDKYPERKRSVISITSEKLARNCFQKASSSYKRQALQETSFIIALQIFFPFLVAGLGIVGSGLLLDQVQDWQVFLEIGEMLVLVPSLLGLKGNLEMTSASRLSTMVNNGHINLKEPRHIVANLALVQIQANVVGFMASAFATLLGFIKTKSFEFPNAIVLCASSMVTASLASITLGAVLIGVILLSHRYHVNPDNVATPIAASFGDLLTLGLLAGFGTLFNNLRETKIWIPCLIIVLVLCLTPMWFLLCYKMSYANEVLKFGWPPLFIAMLISSGSGFILDIGSEKFGNLAVFQPVISGIGGNLVAIQASRMATYLQSKSIPGFLCDLFPTLIPNPIRVYFGKENVHARVARVLLAFAVPGHLVFMSIIYAIKQPKVQMTPFFVMAYLLAGFIQVILLLYICILICNILWRLKINIDSNAIPLLTALGDVVGTGLLTLAFLQLAVLHDVNSLPDENKQNYHHGHNESFYNPFDHFYNGTQYIL